MAGTRTELRCLEAAHRPISFEEAMRGPERLTAKTFPTGTLLADKGHAFGYGYATSSIRTAMHLLEGGCPQAALDWLASTLAALGEVRA